jgi:hypothetical protein
MIFIRIASFLLFTAIALSAPFPLFLFCALLYVFFWSGYELFVIAVLIDGYFGPSSFSVTYIVSTGILVFCGELLRPYVSWYTTHT